MSAESSRAPLGMSAESIRARLEVRRTPLDPTPPVRFPGGMAVFAVRRIVRLASSFVLLVLLAPVGASARRAPAPQFEGAVEVHPSIALASGAGAGLGLDLRGTYWAAFERGYRAGPDFVIGWANFPLDGPGSASLLCLAGGARFAFSGFDRVTPSLFGRVGLHPVRGPRWGRWFWGGSWLGHLGLEGGGALDLSVADNVKLGGHAGLNLLGNGFAYFNLGAHLAVTF